MTFFTHKMTKKRLQKASLALILTGNPYFTIMADKDDKTNGNVPGKFYVDANCIDCDLCRETAPNNFGRDDDEGVSFVSKQPETDEELELCAEAMEGCPVEAIGDDGDE